MRFLKPLLAGATLLTLAAPAFATAEPYFAHHGRDSGYSYDNRGDYGRGYRGDYGRGYRGDTDRWENRRSYRDGWRFHDHYRGRHEWGDGGWGRGWR